MQRIAIRKFSMIAETESCNLPRMGYIGAFDQPGPEASLTVMADDFDYVTDASGRWINSDT